MISFRLNLICQIYAPWFTDEAILFLVGRGMSEEEFKKKVNELKRMSFRIGRRIHLRDVYGFLNGGNSSGLGKN